MKTTFVLSFILLLVSSAWAQDFATRMAQTYRDTDKNYDIDCYYSYNKTWKLITPKSDTVKGNSTLTRSFEVDSGDYTVNMDFRLSIQNGKVIYEALFEGKYLSTAPLKTRDFYLAPVSDANFSKEFELNKLMCSVNFAYALPYNLDDGDYHINVHPHTVYDWQNKLKEPIEKYLNDNKFQSLLLLEAGNVRGNSVNILDFFAGKEPNLVMPNYPSTLVNVPMATPIIVSPAGNSRYVITAEREINVTFTGGNHNYCIWNVARHISENLLNSKSSAVVNFKYDMSAIVAQQRGVERTGINFPRGSVNRSNLLKDLLADTSIQKTYHTNYLFYFSKWLADEYIGMYKTYTVDYEGPGFKEVRTYKGNGTRDLKITFRYF